MRATIAPFIADAAAHDTPVVDGSAPDLTSTDLASADLALSPCSGDSGLVDFLNDPNNCGGCGRRCCSRTCVNGMCFCDGVGLTYCPTGTDGCLNHPYDLALDHDNCGACGHACDPRQACRLGVCR